MTSTEASSVEPVAIVGMACRVPGADDVGQLWKNLLNGVESVRICSPEEQAALGVPPSVLRHPDFVPVSAVLGHAEYFDAPMFGMSAAEAELRDPQHRLFLELCYTALEDSGYDPRRYGGDIGVFAGSGEDSYQWRYVRRNRAAAARSGEIGLAVNSHPDYVATLASYRLGLTGPSLTVHTACSTSLVAVHIACEALRNGECDMALAGAADLELPLGAGYVYLEGGPVSRDGHCRAFDAAASGTVWSSGGAVVVLKRLADATADGDDIRAVIIGDAVNNDGDRKVGFTAPSQEGQAAVIAQALSVADIDPRTIGFVEAHGTGTVLGDPIEVAALTSVYQRHTADRGWCAIGSLKTNVGHLGPASGAAGLIKAALAVRHGVIPPSLNYETPNPQIRFGENPFFVNTASSVWDDADMPRRAAVSSFGMGGTNAHLILEQAPPRPSRAEPRRGQHLIQLSARTDTALAASAAALAGYLDQSAPGGEHDLADVAYTLRVGRQQLPRRLAVVAADEAEAARALRDERRWISGVVAARAAEPVFVFPGQGAQRPGMAAAVYASEAVYRDTVDECCELLSRADVAPGSLASLRGLLTAPGGEEDALRPTALAQPALFIVEYALAALWRSWGVTPAAMIGHSIGEYVAATCADVFQLADALSIVAARGSLMQSLPPGSMLAVQLDATELSERLPDSVSVAAVNAPGSCVVAGPADAIDELARTLGEAHVRSRRLRTSHAFHSAMMDPILPAFRDVVARFDLRPPRIPFASNSTGTWITADQAVSPWYWARHLRDAVRFGDCVAAVAGRDSGLFLECGPGRQLSGLIQSRRNGDMVIPCLPNAGEQDMDCKTLAAAAGQLWAAGCPLDADAFGPHGNRVVLPTYPWERGYHWISPDPGPAEDHERAAGWEQGEDDGAGARFAAPAWRQAPPLGFQAPASRALVFAAGDDDALAGGPVVDEMAARGCEVAMVLNGDRYAADGAGAYRVRPGHREDYEALIADLVRQGGIPAHIVHCWTMACAPAAGAAAATWQAQEQGFFSLLFLVQALAGAIPDGGIRLDVVTAGTQEAVGLDLSRPEHATVAGIVKVLPLEFPWLTARHIDVDPGCPAPDALVNEICAAGPAGPAGEPLVALRNGRRWLRRFGDITVPPAGSGGDAVLRERGVYLITGGTGGIGITVAEELAVRYAARLVLTSRDGLPPRAEWETAPSAPARVTRAIEAIRRMENAGAEVTVIAADVADVAAARAVRDEVISRYGQLNGILHAAGIPGGGMAEVKDREAAADVLRPKIAGTLALRDAFAGDALDFVLLCSSVTAITGGFGQVDYCAANAFLDAHAASEHGWNARVVSANWGAWRKVGMAAEVSAPAAFRALQRGERMAAVRHGLLTGRYLAQGDGRAWCSGTVSAQTDWVLDGHRVAGVPVLPGTACLEAVRCAFEETYPPPGPGHVVELSDVVLTQPLAVPDGTSAEVRVVFTAAADGAGFEIVSRVDGEAGGVHARGSAAWIAVPAGEPADLDGIRDRCSLGVRTGAELRLSASGLITFGDRWGSLQYVLEGDKEQLALLEARSDQRADADLWVIHPALLDEATTLGRSQTDEPFLPFGYGRVVIMRQLPARVWCHLRHRDASTANTALADLSLYDDAGAGLLHVEDFAMRRVDAAAMTDAVGSVARDARTADGIAPAVGADAFRRLVDARIAPQAAVTAEPIGELIAATRRVNYQAIARDLPGVQADARAGRAPEGLAAARNDRERAVARLFAELLGNTGIGRDDDFFDAGGNSLVAVQLITSLREQFGVRLPMRRFFDHPTIAGIAAIVDEMSGQADTAAAGAG